MEQPRRPASGREDTIRTERPRPARPPPLGAVALAGSARASGPSGSSTAWRSPSSGRSARGCRRAALSGLTASQLGQAGDGLRARRLLRCALLRLPDRSFGPEAALPRHPARLPARHGRNGVRGQLRLVRALPVPHRIRDRRRVRGDQLGDRRAHPRAAFAAGSTWRSTAASGSARPLGARLTAGPARHRRSSAPTWAGASAFGLGARARRSAILLVRRYVPGEPALADGPRHAPTRPSSSSPRSRRRSTTRRAGETCRSPMQEIEIHPRAERRASSTIARDAASRTTRGASLLGLALMIGAGVPLQRRALQLHGLVLTDVLRRRRRASPGSTSDPLRASATSSARCCSGRLFDTVGRRDDDHRHLLASAGSAMLDRRLSRRAHRRLGLGPRRRASCVTFFFASAAASVRLPDGERDLPAGDPGDGDRALLRDRHGHRRRDRPAATTARSSMEATPTRSSSRFAITAGADGDRRGLVEWLLSESGPSRSTLRRSPSRSRRRRWRAHERALLAATTSP